MGLRTIYLDIHILNLFLMFVSINISWRAWKSVDFVGMRWRNDDAGVRTTSLPDSIRESKRNLMLPGKMWTVTPHAQGSKSLLPLHVHADSSECVQTPLRKGWTDTLATHPTDKSQTQCVPWWTYKMVGQQSGANPSWKNPVRGKYTVVSKINKNTQVKMYMS